MTYQWKIPGLYGVNAQTAGEEIERIHRKHGQLLPADIVDESRHQSAPLHGVFEWRDQEAAEKYRQVQARELLRAIVVVDSGAGLREPVRAFVRVQQGYQPMELVIKRPDQLEELKAAAFRDLEAFRQKYQTLCKVPEFEPVFQALQGTVGKKRLYSQPSIP